MARKDDIFKSFLTHEILENKYKLNQENIPNTIRHGLNSEIPIIKAIALIIDGLEKNPTATDTELRNTILQFLNTSI